jgi:hypothetical protein
VISHLFKIHENDQRKIWLKSCIFLRNQDYNTSKRIYFQVQTLFWDRIILFGECFWHFVTNVFFIFGNINFFIILLIFLGIFQYFSVYMLWFRLCTFASLFFSNETVLFVAYWTIAHIYSIRRTVLFSLTPKLSIFSLQYIPYFY